MTDTALAGLRSAIERAGYYPELVADAVDAAVAGEDVEAFVVHQETTFDSEEVRRHITVLVLTTGRLVLGHADDHPADEVTQMPPSRDWMRWYTASFFTTHGSAPAINGLANVHNG